MVVVEKVVEKMLIIVESCGKMVCMEMMVMKVFIEDNGGGKSREK